MEPLVALRRVKRAYGGNPSSYWALRGVSLEISRGEFVALVGRSGSGKSTLLNLIGGIDRLDSGEVTVAGERIDRISDRELAVYRRDQVGIVHQFFHLVQNLSVLMNISLPALLTDRSPMEIRSRAVDLMALLGIGHLAERLPTQLSGGERQRVAIARALINRPALLLADEPTGALDQESAGMVLALFQELHHQGQTIVMVTHNPLVARYADRIAVMAEGLVIKDRWMARRHASGLSSEPWDEEVAGS